MDDAKLTTPPHSPEAERGVIGAILLDAETGDETRILDYCQAKGITDESFFDPKLRLVFQTACEMSRASEPIDALTIANRLKATGRYETVGGGEALRALLESTPTTVHAEYYVDILRRQHLLRKLIAVARACEARCYKPESAGEADVIIGEFETSVLSIGGTDAVRDDWKTAIAKTLKSIETTFDRGGGVFEGLPTGFRYIDEKLLGLKPSEMIVIAARPSVGKTALAMNIAECVATGTDINGVPFKSVKDERGEEVQQRPHPVLVFSLEMDTASLSKRMLCGRAHVNAWRIARNLMDPEEKTKASASLIHAASELKPAPIYIDDTSGLDIADLRARARREKRKHKIELIVIDYLQLCGCREVSKQGRQIEVSRISGQIKSMAKELKIPVIVLSQLSRANEQRGDKYEVPKLSDLRDSGAIEQDADVVMLLRRPSMVRATRDDKNTQNLAFVDVAKHRNGEVGDVKMDFIREWVRYGDRDQRDDVAKAEEMMNGTGAEGVGGGELDSADRTPAVAPEPVAYQTDLI